MFKIELRQSLERAGVFVDDLERMAAWQNRRRVIRLVQEWAGPDFPTPEIHRGIWSYKRDVLEVPVAQGIYGILLPWISTGTTDHMPVISLKELGRITDMHPRKIFHLVQGWKQQFHVAKTDFTTILDTPRFEDRAIRPVNQADHALRDTAYHRVNLTFQPAV